MQNYEKNPNGLQLFDFNNSPIRIIIQQNGEPLFVAGDVCKVLELSNVAQAISRLDDDEKSIIILNEYGRDYEKPVINESGLYSLVLSSRKPEAKAFKKWVTNEVLPSIRKTGAYVSAPKSTLEMLADGFAQMAKLEREQLEQSDRLRLLEAKATNLNNDYFSLAGYYGLKCKRWDLTVTQSQQFGKKLSKISNELGYEVLRVQDARFGVVGTYHLSVLQAVLGF